MGSDRPEPAAAQAQRGEKQAGTGGVGGALNNLSRIDSGLFACIQQAPRIISFRNKLTHEYDRVDDSLVMGVIHKSLPPLGAICSDLIDNLPQEEI